MSSQSEQQLFLGYSDDPSEKQEARQFRHIRPTRANLLPSIVVCFVTSLFWGALFFLFHPSTSTQHTTTPTSTSAVHTHTSTSSSLQGSRHNVTSGARLLTCGSDVATARASGCRYDVLLNNWVPGPCYDQEFVDEYLDDDSWAGYADEALTVRLTEREMSEREWYWTSLRDHVNHCAMMWRKQFWVLFEERRALDTVIANPGHTDHCAQYLTDAGDRNWTHPTRTEMGFAGCWVREDP